MRLKTWFAVPLIVMACSAMAQPDEPLKVRFEQQMSEAARFLQVGAYDSCRGRLEDAIRLAESEKRFVWLARARNELGVLNIYRGNYASALSSIQEALSVYERMGLQEGIAECHNNMGAIYYAQNDFRRARISYGKSLVIREQGTDLKALGITLNNLGDVNAKLGEPDAALQLHERSLAIWEKLGSISGRAITLKHMAECNEQQGEYQKALQVMYQAHEALRNDSGSMLPVIVVGIRIGDLLNRTGKSDEAIRWCKEAYEVALSLNSKQELKKSCLCLHNAYAATDRPKEALHYYQQFVAVRDSLFGQEMTKEVTRLEMNYAFEKKQLADSLRFEAEKELQHVRIQRQRIGLVSTGGILLLVAALGFAIHNGKRKSDTLLLNILPKATADELKQTGSAKARHFDEVTVLFTDFKGFTQMSVQLSPEELVSDLHECFSAFDSICEKHGIEKIKTIGDAYMAAGGLPTPNTTHAHDVVKAALEMAQVVEEGKAKKVAAGLPYFEVRIGIHTGPVVAGIVGIRKFQYDIWGDTVNTASRMESSGEVGKVNISETTHGLLKDDASLTFESRGKIQAKGKGEMEMYFVANA